MYVCLRIHKSPRKLHHQMHFSILLFSKFILWSRNLVVRFVHKFLSQSFSISSSPLHFDAFIFSPNLSHFLSLFLSLSFSCHIVYINHMGIFSYIDFNNNICIFYFAHLIWLFGHTLCFMWCVYMDIAHWTYVHWSVGPLDRSMDTQQRHIWYLHTLTLFQ